MEDSEDEEADYTASDEDSIQAEQPPVGATDKDGVDEDDHEDDERNDDGSSDDGAALSQIYTEAIERAKRRQTLEWGRIDILNCLSIDNFC